MNHRIIHQRELQKGIAVEIPDQMKKSIFKWATSVECLSYNFGHTLHQRYTGKRCTAHNFVFLLKEGIELELSLEGPTVILQYQLKGNVSLRLPEGATDLVLKEKTYRAMYLPQGVATCFINAGVTETILFEFSSRYVEVLAEDYEEIADLYSHLLQASLHSHILPTGNIDYDINDIIRDELYKLSDFQLEHHLRIVINNLLLHYQVHLQTPIKEEDSSAYYKDLVEKIKAEIKEEPNKLIHNYAYFIGKYHISKATIDRIFRYHANTTLNSYRYEHLMKKAFDLKEKKMRLEDIAMELGYDNKSSLYHSMQAYIEKNKTE